MIPTYIVWPLQQNLDPTDPAAALLPSSLSLVAQKFTNFYRRQFHNRHLTWLHQLSRLVLSHRNGDGKTFELICTVPQATIMLKFQSCDELPVKELLGALSLDQFRLVCDPMIKADLLRYNCEETMVSLNTQWRGGKSRVAFAHHSLLHSIERDVHLPASPTDSLIPSTIMDIDQEGSSIALSENRKYFLQSIVVRVLKRHTQLSWAKLIQLVDEIVSAPGPMSFHPSSEHLKLVLQQLEDKQYIEYDAKRDLYVYMP